MAVRVQVPSRVQTKEFCFFTTFVSLKKKYSILACLLLSYSIVLAHSLVPHHHHVSEVELAAHHQAEHEHHDDGESDELSHILSHFIHSADAYTVSNDSRSGKNQTYQFVVFPADLVQPFSICELSTLFFVEKPPDRTPVYFLLRSLSSGLRAPPSIVS